MKSRKAIALVLLSIATLLSCSSDDSTSTTTTQVEVGTPTPPIPSEVNAIPFTVGAVAAAGNAEIRMSLPSETPEAAEGFSFLKFKSPVVHLNHSLFVPTCSVSTPSTESHIRQLLREQLSNSVTPHFRQESRTKEFLRSAFQPIQSQRCSWPILPT